MAEENESTWIDRYDTETAMRFFSMRNNYGALAGWVELMGNCLLCDRVVAGRAGRFGYHLETAHGFPQHLRGIRTQGRFIHVALVLGATPVQVAIHLGARVAKAWSAAKAPGVGMPELVFLESQIGARPELLNQIETLVGLGCSTEQIREQLIPKESP